MRFKLDENLGRRVQQLFREADHDAETVPDEQLRGCSDQTLYEICRVENRCLVTLDLDFSNVLRKKFFFWAELFPARFLGLLAAKRCRSPYHTSALA